MAAADWYSTKEALETIQKFHDTFARQPQEMLVARERHIEIMEELIGYLKRERNILKRAEYTGSAYEGLKVGGKELEFDVMFVLNDGELLEVEKDPAWNLYGSLKPKRHTDKFTRVMEYGEVSPFQVRYWFHGELQKWINKREANNFRLRGEVVLHYSGPAIRASVYKNGAHWYFVDLVPAYEIPRCGTRETYVAKPKGDDDSWWRHSFSVEEKAKLQNIDGRDNGCRKKVIRILKVLRDTEPGLDKMVSFYIKSKVIDMTDQWSLDWSERNLAKRLKDVMLELSRCMETGQLTHPYDRSVNLLHDLSYRTRENIAFRLKRLANNERIAKEKFQSYYAAESSLGASNNDMNNGGWYIYCNII